MHACPQMKAVISQLAARYELDLTQRGTHLRLDMPGYDRLCVEHIGYQRISVAHYFEINGDLVAEPDIVFWVDTQGNWIPLEISQSLTGWRVYAELNATATAIVQIRPQAQRSLAEFAELWAQNLRAQGWLHEATLTRSSAPSAKSVWPHPTVAEPDEEELAEWFADSVCEATDGCIVEHDGRCPHGHPSWLLRLGLV